MAGFLQGQLDLMAHHNQQLQNRVMSLESLRGRADTERVNLGASWRGLGFAAADEVGTGWSQNAKYRGTEQWQGHTDGSKLIHTNYDSANQVTYGIMRGLADPSGSVTA